MVQSVKEKTMERKLDKLLIFIIPIWYTLKTRFIKRSSKGFLFWASEYLFPVLLAMWCINTSHFNVIDATLAILSVYCFYELGYIQNDCETIKRESQPTLRLSEDELAVYEANKALIYTIRIVLILAVCVYYFVMGLSLPILIVMIAVLPYYILYNTVRGKICDYLINPLTAYRYCMPLILYTIGTINWTAVIYIIFAYIFPTFLQYCVREKNGKPSAIALKIIGNYKDRDVFRIKYYSLFLMTSVFVFFMGYLPIEYLSIAAYFLIFRISTYIYRLRLN